MPTEPEDRRRGPDGSVAPVAADVRSAPLLFPSGRPADGGVSARPGQIAHLVEVMGWPEEPERSRLDGELQRQMAPLLGEVVSRVGRLKAVLAGLTDDGRAVLLDEPGEAGDVRPGAEIAAFRPGRFVAVHTLEGNLERAATNAFAGLADRALRIVIPELEIALTELIVLLHEYIAHQELELEDLLDTLPGEVLAALVDAVPTWEADAPRRRSELARLRRHLRATASEARSEEESP